MVLLISSINQTGGHFLGLNPQNHPFSGGFEEAVTYIGQFVEGEVSGEFRKFEIIAKFSNGDEINGSFRNKTDATEFLNYLSDFSSG